MERVSLSPAIYQDIHSTSDSFILLAFKMLLNVDEHWVCLQTLNKIYEEDEEEEEKTMMENNLILEICKQSKWDF